MESQCLYSTEAINKLYPIIKTFEGYLIKEATLEERLKNFTTQGKSEQIHKDRLHNKLSEQEELIQKRIEEITKDEKVNLENILGFINQNKLNSYLNISNIMRLSKLDFSDLYYTRDLDLLLARRPFLEKVIAFSHFIDYAGNYFIFLYGDRAQILKTTECRRI